MSGWLIAGVVAWLASAPLVLIGAWLVSHRARRQARMRDAALRASLGRLARAKEELRTCREQAQFDEIAASMPEVAAVGRQQLRRQSLRRVK